MPKPDASNILVIKHGAFGDIVQADGAMRDIRENYPDATITVLTAKPYAEILQRCPWVDRVMVDPRTPRWNIAAMARLRTALRHESFDMVYDLQNSGRTAFYYRWFFKDTAWSGKAKNCSHPVLAPTPHDLIGLRRFDTQLRSAGLKVGHALLPDVSWMAADVSDLLTNAGIASSYIVLIPGSSARHLKKRWPSYAELASRLLVDGWRVVTVPGPDEMELCRALPGTMLVGAGGTALGWFDLAGVLKGAAYVVGNDTGPTHLAAHIGTPGLALFGAYIAAERTGIQRPNFRVIEVPKLRRLPAEQVHKEIRRDLGADHSEPA